jgi:hypothetical protein
MLAWAGPDRPRQLLTHGAATEFRDGGCAIGAALHGWRHCQDPEGRTDNGNGDRD